MLLSVEQARVVFPTSKGDVAAVDRVSLEVDQGETLAVVGESGCGKTTLARAILGLQPLESGRIILNGVEVKGTQRGQAERVGMVWQDPFASIDPRWTIRKILEEPFRLCGKQPELEELVTNVGLDNTFLDRYPHQLSGGQRQRVAIGRALALKPPLVICDEPTAALDLSVKAQILNLLNDLGDRLNCSFLYISHDLTTVQYLADRVAVMYLGQVVESGTVDQVFSSPEHPYTNALLSSAPSLETIGRLPAVAKGEIPDPTKLGVGCRFASRCPRVRDECSRSAVPWSPLTDHNVLCIDPMLRKSGTTDEI